MTPEAARAAPRRVPGEDDRGVVRLSLSLSLLEKAMRKLFPLLSVAVLSMGATLVWAAAEVTITGEGQCAKCALKETPKCQNAIVTEEGGKKVTYYLVHNGVSKKFHSNICQATKKITATGEVKDENGKKMLTPKKIELAE